jgi:hypothetical protein
MFDSQPPSRDRRRGRRPTRISRLNTNRPPNVHRQPGGAVCIIPVDSQHRGRLFLPFADDDPKASEVVSKVLLLSKDDEIQDPTILEQLVR